MRRAFHQILIPFKLVTRSIFLVGLSSLLLLAGCEGQPEDRQQDLLQLFAGELDDGSLVEACEELSNICAADNMGCAAFDLFCGGDTTEIICAQLGQTCEEKGVGCEVYQQQCEDPTQPPREECCQLAQQCLMELGPRSCADGNCDPTDTGEVHCEGDPATGIKCESEQEYTHCEGQENGVVHCKKCRMSEDGQEICDETTCDENNGCEIPGGLPQSCELAIKVCRDIFPVDDLLNSGMDPYQIVEQVCEKPEPTDPLQECCEAAEHCYMSTEKPHCEASNEPDKKCMFDEEPCQRAMDICGSVFPLDQVPEQDLYSLYEQHCQDETPPPPPQEGKCCEMAQMCYEDGQWFDENNDPAQGQISEICAEALEICRQEYGDFEINEQDPEHLFDLFHKVCQPEEPPPPPPQDDECCELAQMCVYDQDCQQHPEKCEDREACQVLMEKCNFEIDLDNPEKTLEDICN